LKIDNFSIADFDKNKFDKYHLGNKVLYDLCNNYPSHTKLDEIHAKIWLIGRSYAASIERRKKKQQINDEFYDFVIEKFLKFNKEYNFDSKLKAIKMKEFNHESLGDILAIHKKLIEFFHSLTGLEKRSLASKYLHFHAPIFPIYDSRVNNSIRKIVKGKLPKLNGDKQYSEFCSKISFLYNFIKSNSNKAPTMREIDAYLVKIANENLKSDL